MELTKLQIFNIIKTFLLDFKTDDDDDLEGMTASEFITYGLLACDRGIRECSQK